MRGVYEMAANLATRLSPDATAWHSYGKRQVAKSWHSYGSKCKNCKGAHEFPDNPIVFLCTLMEVSADTEM